MEGAGSDTFEEGELRAAPRPRWRKKRWMVPAFVVLLALIALGVAWFSRYRIADNIIAEQLAAYDLQASYEVERIGGQRQVISDLVIGDPDRPDMTAEQVVVRLRYRLGLPEIRSVTLVRARVFGSYRGGTLSFGSLDKVLFAESDQPPGLPDLDLTLVDGRGLLETDFGPVGVKAEGSGRLNDGFSGTLAIAAPELDGGGCALRQGSAYGKVTVDAGAPRFAGPLRFARMTCPGSALALENYAVETQVSLDADLAKPELAARIDGGATRMADYALAALGGTLRASLPGDVATVRYSLVGRGARSPQALAAVLSFDGQGRITQDLQRIETDAQVEASGLRPGPQAVAALSSLGTAGEGTLLAPLARQIASALDAKARGSELAADLRLRRTGERLSLIVPNAELRAGNGERIVSLSRVQYGLSGDGPATLAGNIATGGAGLPRIVGRMERTGGAGSVFRLSMERYAAGDAALAIPELMVVQQTDGALRFDGRIAASGPLPGGSARDLRVPVDGRWQPGGRLTLWTRCTPIAFDGLALANLRFERHSLTLCPARGRPILAYGPDGIRLAAGTGNLDLSGYLGETPIRLRSGPVGFAYPGVMTARELDVALGPADTASRFVVNDLVARFGADIAGSFADADIRLAAVPMDMREASGDWRFAGGVLSIDGAEFRLLDRQELARFEPLVARDAVLRLEDNVIRAQAALRHPASDRLVTEVDIRHDLATGAGHADLDIPGLQFDGRLQPDQLSRLALGVIANADGAVTGTGRIDWAASGAVTSSGSFSTESLDFAAAFGPVRGASGTIEFTDLLNLTTAPNQKLRVASINPGVEVFDGEVEFALQDGAVLQVAGGNWPFMGGRLMLRDVDLNLGASEERRYIFEIVGLEAQQFVAQMELENISATGTFDGTIPIVFDANGNGRIDTGVLVSRPPGGNVAYVGELTYEDLSPIANFAFDALKSLDYSQMRVIMEGPLTGEIVTRVRFDGVSQGEGAEGNFITRRLAALPLQFRLNIRAQFYQLMTSLKSLYDPAAVRDPRELGLLSDDGKRLLRRSITGEEAEPDIEPEDIIPDEPTIQQQESE